MAGAAAMPVPVADAVPLSGAEKKWHMVSGIQKQLANLDMVSVRLQAAAMCREVWETPTVPPLLSAPRRPTQGTSKSVASARFLVRQSDRVREQLNAFCAMVARSSLMSTGSADAASFALGRADYIELRLRLRKALEAPPFELDAARAAAEADWQADCPPGGRVLSRHLLADSLFRLADERCHSTTPEEYAAFLAVLFRAVARGSPSALRPLDDVAHRNVAAEAARIAAAAVRQQSHEHAAVSTRVRECVGPQGVLQLSSAAGRTRATSPHEQPEQRAPPSPPTRLVSPWRSPASPAASIPFSFPTPPHTAEPISARARRSHDAGGSSGEAIAHLGVCVASPRQRDSRMDSRTAPPPPLTTSRAQGRKTPRLAITLSSSKVSALAGAPCAELPPPSPPRSPRLLGTKLSDFGYSAAASRPATVPEPPGSPPPHSPYYLQPISVSPMERARTASPSPSLSSRAHRRHQRAHHYAVARTTRPVGSPILGSPSTVATGASGGRA